MLQPDQVQEMVTKFIARCTCAQCRETYECTYYSAKKSRTGHLCNGCKNRIRDMKTFTHAELLEVLEYHPVSGDITYRVDTQRKAKGESATMNHIEGYLIVEIGKKQYLAHRLAWYMVHAVWPTQIDHVDHDRTNNKLTNLRDVSSRENQLNTSISRNNTSGVNGVRLLPSGRYNAFITVNRKQLSLGTYDTIGEAAQARKRAEQLHGFHANHGS